MQNEKYKLRKARSLKMLNSGVEPVKNGFNEYYIPSQNNPKIKYKVTIKGGWYSCECPDNQKGNLCKHILLLKTFLAIKLQTKEIKQNISITRPCPHCESKNIVKDGTRKTTLGKKQRWLCQDCKKRFVLEPIKNIKGNADSVALVMDLYFKGCSLRNIQDTLQQFYGLKIHHETVRRWINKYMRKINKYVEQQQPQTSREWQVDEQMINIKGNHKWVWNCLDVKTRFLLANNLTDGRTLEETKQIFNKAKDVTGADKNLKITTDGMKSYPHAIGNVFHKMNDWKHNFTIEHKYNAGIKKKENNNNTVERFHGTFRNRDKVMRAFKKDDKTANYLDNFRTYYNFMRKHTSLEGLTPAQASGISETRKVKELLVKSLEVKA